MTSGELLVAIDEADWERFAGPEYYDPESARRSLRELASIENEAAADTAYNDVLFGIGNSHAGSYYPAALCAVPLLVRISASGQPWPRYAALEVLTDLLISFNAEAGYESFDGELLDLTLTLHQAMEDARLISREGSKSVNAHALLAELRTVTHKTST